MTTLKAVPFCCISYCVFHKLLWHRAQSSGLNSFNMAGLRLRVLHFYEKIGFSLLLLRKKQPSWTFVFLIRDRDMSTEKHFFTIREKRFKQPWGLIGSDGAWGRVQSTSHVLNWHYLDPHNWCHDWCQGEWVLPGQIAQCFKRCHKTGFLFKNLLILKCWLKIFKNIV